MCADYMPYYIQTNRDEVEIEVWEKLNREGVTLKNGKDCRICMKKEYCCKRGEDEESY